MLATIEKIVAVEDHPNADRLDIVKVLGYDAIVSKGAFKADDTCVFIQPDTVLPADRAWAQPYLRHTKGGRVRAARLRGVWSMGIVLTLPECSLTDPYGVRVNELPATLEVGAEVGEMLGIIKYENPQQLVANGQAKRMGLPFNIPKTDEERWQNVRDLEKLIGERVDVTLKVDGSSLTVYCVLPGHDPSVVDSPAVGVCSRSLELKDEPEFQNRWLDAVRKHNVVDKLKAYCLMHNVSLALRGEVYGQGIQNFSHNPHSKLPVNCAFYSCYNIKERKYEGPDDPHYFDVVCHDMDLPIVPFVTIDAPLRREAIAHYDHELKELNGQSFEGVVFRGKDFSFKVINKHYDAEK